MKNKITSLFFSDIVGYSSLFSSNEQLALNLLDEHNIIVEKQIINNNGNIIKNIGDAVFASFPSAEDAHKASIQIQKDLKKRNNIQTNENKLEIRIGLHHGTVYVKDGDLFGNNVNICSRLESIAFPSAIACSQDFLDQLANIEVFKREYGFLELKNIQKPIMAYKVYNDSNHFTSENENAIIDFIKSRGIKIQKDDNIEKVFLPIGFLYPKNLGDMWTVDESDENSFFSIEVNKQIIDYANKISIIRTPSFESIIKYKDKELQEIAFELSLEYLLQSTIMVDNDTFKIFFTLFSINSAQNIYEKSYEGKFHDMKNIIGKLLIDLAELLEFKIANELMDMFKADLNVDNTAYKLFLEGKSLSYMNSSPDSLEKSKFKLKQSIEIDDQFAEAYAALGMTYSHLGNFDEADEYFDEAEEIADESDNLDTLSFVFNYLGIYYRNQRKEKKSIRYFEKALKSLKKLNDRANLADIYNNMALTYSISGKHDLAMNLSLKAEMIYKELDERIRLSFLYGQIGIIKTNMHELEDAIKYYNLAKQIFLAEDMMAKYAQALILMADTYLTLNNLKEAKINLKEANENTENFSLPILKARYSWLMAKINLIEDQLDDALDYVEEAIDIFDEINNKIKLCDTLLLKVQILVKKDKQKKAEKIFKKAERMAERLGDSLINITLENTAKLINP